MVFRPEQRPWLRIVWAMILCAGLLLPLPARAADNAPSQLLLPLVGNKMCSGRMDPDSPMGIQMYGDSGYTSPLFPYLLSSGAAWLRVVTDWNSIEPNNTSPTGYNWSTFDRAIAASVHSCINIIATIDHTADWAAVHETVPPFPNRSPIKTDNLADFAQFVGALVERYDGDGVNDAPSGVVVEHWELYNEPDFGNGFDGGGWGDDGARYAQMLKLVYPALKAANPNAKLVFGGIAFDGFTENGGPFVRSFTEDVLKAGGGDFFDVMNFHYYPVFRSSWTTTNGTGMPEKTAAIRAILQEYGLQKPVVITEAGWHSTEGGAYPSSQEMQARYVTQFFAQAAALDLDFLIWWMLADVSQAFGQKNGLVTDAIPPVPKLSLTVYRTAAARLGPAEHVSTLTAAETKDANLEVYRFRDPTDKIFYVAWLNPVDTGKSAPVSVAGARATVYDKSNNLVSTLSDGDDGLADGQITVNVGGSPVYIIIQ